MQPVPLHKAVHRNWDPKRIKYIVRALIFSLLLLIPGISVALFFLGAAVIDDDKSAVPSIMALIPASLILLFVITKLRKIQAYHTRECAAGRPNVKTSQRFRDAALMARAWQTSVYNPENRRRAAASEAEGAIKAVSPCDATFYQPIEGFCPMATVNTVLQSMANPYVVELGKLPRPYSMGGLYNFIRDSVLPSPGVAQQIERLEFVDGDLSLEEFIKHMHDLTNPRVRIMANFHRLPLFFADRGCLTRSRKAFAGHWSPIGGIVRNVDGNAGNDVVMILDVNESYGPWMTEIHRLWEAVNTRDFADGQYRGMLKLWLSEEGAGIGSVSEGLDASQEVKST